MVVSLWGDPYPPPRAHGETSVGNRSHSRTPPAFFIQCTTYTISTYERSCLPGSVQAEYNLRVVEKALHITIMKAIVQEELPDAGASGNLPDTYRETSVDYQGHPAFLLAGFYGPLPKVSRCGCGETREPSISWALTQKPLWVDTVWLVLCHGAG